jgi:hypothetical protein
MIDEIHRAYRALKTERPIITVPELEPISVVVRRETIQANALPEILGRYAERQGWVRLQSALYRTSARAAATPPDGLPLAAGLCLSDSESAHLRQDDKGGWTLYRYRDFSTLAEAESACAVGSNAWHCLRQRTTVLTGDIPAGAAGSDELGYYVYWGADGAHIRRLFTRFDGFRVHHQGDLGS